MILFLLLAAGPAPLRHSDQLDLVLLAADRPVSLRFHVRAGDRAYDAGWNDWAKSLFDWHDKDKDGFLSKDEAVRLLPAEVLTALANGAIRADGPRSNLLSALDTDRDGKVSRAEFSAWLKRNGLGAVALSVDATRAETANRVNDALWKRLDGDGDGRLSEAELAKLPSLLDKLDENEDEQLSESELTHEAGPEYAGFAPRLAARGPAPDFLLDQGGQAPAALARTLIRLYDKDKDGKLSRAEAGLDAEAFAALDADGDGKLSARELEMLRLRPADLTFRGRVGNLPGASGLLASVGLAGSTSRLALLTPAGQGATKSLSKVSNNASRLKLARTMADLSVDPTPAFNRRSGAVGFYLNQYSLALGAEKGKGLTREQAKDNPYVNMLFAAADRDADGVLTRKEITDYLAIAGAAGSRTLSVRAEDYGQNLFASLDADGNGQLSVREMRTAWSRVRMLSKDGKTLSRDDLPRRMRIELAEGSFASRQFFAVAAQPTSGMIATPLDLRGAPAWFRKMDKNGDGDLSFREWLGSEEDFKKLDLDGDGLISLDEARKAKADPTKK
ncbi:MAG: EF-hand domain-containing protein [Gemmataceae bacterium]|nr:EF-hand domain-containing protein [Gemmataceae bacterium]